MIERIAYPPQGGTAQLALEGGAALLLTGLTFPLTETDARAIGRGGVEGAKNISYNQVTGEVRGTDLAGQDRADVADMLSRFGTFAENLVLAVAPSYGNGLVRARTSFRPVEIAGRTSSWRKDDTRLHVDAFPSTPTQGQRILRVFANVDPDGTPRHWRLGPDFETYARTFLPKTRGLFPGAARFMAATGITKSRRTLYDQTMLGLHDEAKRDMGWQRGVEAEEVDFYPGQVWMVFTDQAPHAALSGRNALEQTFYVSLDALAAPDRAPAAILSRLKGRDVLKPLF